MLAVLSLQRPLVAAYLTAYRAIRQGGTDDAVADLARGLAKRLDRGAQTAYQNTTDAFTNAKGSNADDMAVLAVTANVDQARRTWSLGRWASMNTDTYGRHATSRGVADAIGTGNTVTISVGKCGLCAKHAGQTVIGRDALPPFHVSCTLRGQRMSPRLEHQVHEQQDDSADDEAQHGDPRQPDPHPVLVTPRGSLPPLRPGSASHGETKSTAWTKSAGPTPAFFEATSDLDRRVAA